jgi:hypothetical protein
MSLGRDRKKMKAGVRVPKGFLTEREVKLLRAVIRSNSQIIDRYVQTIDLLVNKERCPEDANTLTSWRNRLAIALDENDTFRKVLWRHLQAIESGELLTDPALDAVSFLAGQIRFRKKALAVPFKF